MDAETPDRPADRDSETPRDADTVPPVKKLRDSVTGMDSIGRADPATAEISPLTDFNFTIAHHMVPPPHRHRPAYLVRGGIACYDCGKRLS